MAIEVVAYELKAKRVSRPARDVELTLTQRGPLRAKKVIIIFTRFWSTPRWRFVVEARAKDGRILAATKHSVYGDRGSEGARFELEDILRRDGIIA